MDRDRHDCLTFQKISPMATLWVNCRPCDSLNPQYFNGERTWTSKKSNSRANQLRKLVASYIHEHYFHLLTQRIYSPSSSSTSRSKSLSLSCIISSKISLASRWKLTLLDAIVVARELKWAARGLFLRNIQPHPYWPISFEPLKKFVQAINFSIGWPIIAVTKQ